MVYLFLSQIAGPASCCHATGELLFPAHQLHSALIRAQLALGAPAHDCFSMTYVELCSLHQVRLRMMYPMVMASMEAMVVTASPMVKVMVMRIMAMVLIRNITSGFFGNRAHCFTGHGVVISGRGTHIHLDSC